MTADTAELMRFVRITQAELFAEGLARFGPDPLDIAFVCPSCGDVATLREWQAIDTTDQAGQNCIGRASMAARDAAGVTRLGCDWAAYGLFRGPWEIVAGDRSLWGFPLAGDPVPDGPVARFLASRTEPATHG